MLYHDIIRQECEIERKVLESALILATLAPDEFAYQFMKKPSFMVHISREVIRFEKCIAVDVKRRGTEEYYQELPVHRGNDSYFMLPRTHILVRTDTQVNRNPLIAPMYRLAEQWYELNLSLLVVSQPEQLSAQTNYSSKYVPAQGLATGGIYSNNDIERL